MRHHVRQLTAFPGCCLMQRTGICAPCSLARLAIHKRGASPRASRHAQGHCQKREINYFLQRLTPPPPHRQSGSFRGSPPALVGGSFSSRGQGCPPCTTRPAYVGKHASHLPLPALFPKEMEIGQHPKIMRLPELDVVVVGNAGKGDQEPQDVEEGETVAWDEQHGQEDGQDLLDNARHRQRQPTGTGKPPANHNTRQAGSAIDQPVQMHGGRGLRTSPSPGRALHKRELAQR